MFLRIISFLAVLATGIGASAQASPGYETIRLSGPATIEVAQTQSIPLNAVRHIKNLVIQAEGLGGDSTIEVIVNGEVKGTIYAPGRDPSYIVTIGETARSVELRHLSGSRMRIHEIFAVVSYWGQPVSNPSGGFRGDASQVRAMAQAVIANVSYLKSFATSADYDTYLFPIKHTAAMVDVMAGAHGPLSRKTLEKLVAVVDQIDFAQNLLQTLIKQDEAFEAVVNLLSMRESIADSLE